uniref:Probable metal-binding protein n=1 Tax=Candidatus Kentrum sp. MB TaxID=2138164 RepID=A0A451B7M0_9GAMM|nr:MAG: probable metal-binding protein [Candidatus Kentron sp. MB]VFK30305.1 MAG: probable metal-binding protein [Candidatus Kentron sp. MB]VFK74281.1 MAG: probable metal-binding protein [Candidatus Kentron sp. MB]
MNESIHGHEVMKMMMNSPVSFTQKSLEKAIHDRFGTQARFHTCSAQGMDAEQLIQFLGNRGKFVGAQHAFTTTKDKICNHE